MGRFKYSDFEKDMNAVLSRHSKELVDIKSKMLNETDDSIADSEQVLQSLGYDLNVLPQYKVTDSSKKALVVPSWESIRDKSVKEFGRECELDALFTDEELNENEEAIKCLNAEYNQLHRLDAADIAIAVLAGLIGSTVDILLVGIPHKTTDGLKAAPLSDYIRNYFDKKFPEDEMQKLANSKVSKVPFDAQDNRNTSVYVDGLSSYYHRLLQLGHDPLLGFVFGVYDILNGKMTTIDKTGKFVSQLMENYADRKEVGIFAALSKLIIHFKSDITTSMGLPAPLMGVFNLFQFGSIGEEEQTIAQIVQGMYYEGYDFIHFCSMSVPAMLIEVIIRLGYAIKRVKEGCSIKDSVPISLNREKHPKLATMLFLGHSASAAINAGRVYFTKNPMAINYPEWIAFAKYSYSQLKWCIVDKPTARNKYVLNKIDEELDLLLDEVNKSFSEFSKDRKIVFS